MYTNSIQFYNLRGNWLVIIFATLLIALKKPNFPHVRMQSMISNANGKKTLRPKLPRMKPQATQLLQEIRNKFQNWLGTVVSCLINVRIKCGKVELVRVGSSF